MTSLTLLPVNEMYELSLFSLNLACRSSCRFSTKFASTLPLASSQKLCSAKQG